MTASAVLNSARSNTRVSEATRLRVVAAAKELQYHPNAIARSLTRRSTNIIGFYSGYGFVDARNAFLAEITGGLLEGCEQYRKDLLTHSTFRGRSVDDIYAELADGKIDGLVLHTPQHDPLVDRLAASHLPVVTVADAVTSLPSVVVDDAQGARLLVTHLAEKGHRHVLYRQGLPAATSTQRRLCAFRHAAAERGMTVTEVTLPLGVSEVGAAEQELLLSGDSTRPTAVACWEDGAAYGLLAECRRLGLRVPQDLAIVGFNGIVLQGAPLPALTTVRAPWAAVARQAVTQVVAQLKGEAAPPETLLPVELIIGETT